MQVWGREGAAETYGKVTHVGEEDVDLDDLGNGRAGLLEDGLEVGDALLGLLGDVALDQDALGVEGDLAGAVDGGGGLDGLGLRWWLAFHGRPNCSCE